MASPRQDGVCGHLKASVDQYAHSAQCRDKGQGSDSCVLKQDCQFCSVLMSEQRTWLSTPTYKIKKDKKSEKASSPSLIDPSSVLVLEQVDSGTTTEKATQTSKAKPRKSTTSNTSSYSKDLKRLDQQYYLD